MSYTQKVKTLAEYFNLSIDAVKNWSKETVENFYNQIIVQPKGVPRINKQVKKEREKIKKKLEEERPARLQREVEKRKKEEKK